MLCLHSFFFCSGEGGNIYSFFGAHTLGHQHNATVCDGVHEKVRRTNLYIRPIAGLSIY